MSQEVPETSPEQPGQAPQLQSPAQVAMAAAGLTLQEAVNLGEINPAMQRRLGERMDQLYGSMIRGAGLQWGPDKTLKIIWPEVENPLIAAAKERAGTSKRRNLKNSTALMDPANG